MKSCWAFLQWLHHFIFLLGVCEASSFSISLAVLDIITVFISDILLGMKWCLVLPLFSSFLMAGDVEHLNGHLYIFFGEISIQILYLLFF